MSTSVVTWGLGSTRKREMNPGHRGGGADSSVLDADTPPPLTVGWRVRGGLGGGGSGRGDGEGGSGRGGGGALGGGGRFGGNTPPRPSIGQSQAPLTSPCPPSNHTITRNLTLTFAAS